MVRYAVLVHTSDVRGAGTDAKVEIELHGNSPTPTLGWTQLPEKGRNCFERNRQDRFELESYVDVGDVEKIGIRRGAALYARPGLASGVHSSSDAGVDAGAGCGGRMRGPHIRHDGAPGPQRALRPKHRRNTVPFLGLPGGLEPPVLVSPPLQATRCCCSRRRRGAAASDDGSSLRSLPRPLPLLRTPMPPSLADGSRA